MQKRGCCDTKVLLRSKTEEFCVSFLEFSQSSISQGPLLRVRGAEVRLKLEESVSFVKGKAVKKMNGDSRGDDSDIAEWQ